MRLIDRQRVLIDHLVAPSVFRGRDDPAGLADDLLAIGPSRLRIVGEQALAKRMSKVRAVFPQTCRTMDEAFAQIAGAFADTCPPFSIERSENAKQFRDYLVALWAKAPPDPAYLQDLLTFEETLWMARRRLNERIPLHQPSETIPSDRRLVRPNGVEILALSHDIRPLMASGGPREVAKRPVHLVVRRARIGAPAKVFEISPVAFDVLRRLEETSHTRTEIAAWSGVDGTSIIGDLIDIGAIVPVS